MLIKKKFLINPKSKKKPELEAVPNSAVVEEAVHAACSRSNTPIN
jgi:hypothetical protein